MRNINQEHKDSLSFHEKIALRITKFVGSMVCACLFAILSLISLPAALATNNIIVIDSWVAQTFLQLVLLSIIMVGQNLQQRHQELLAEKDYETDMENKKNTDTILAYLRDIHLNVIAKGTEIHE